MKGCFLCGSILVFRLCVSSVFGTRSDFDMNASHIFPQGVLAVITLKECDWCYGDQSLHLLYCDCHTHVEGGRVSPPVFGLEATRYVSKLKCEVGRTGVFLLGKERSIPLQDLCPQN